MELGKKWSEEDDQFLRDNWSSLTINQLGQKLERSRNSVAGRIHRLGLPTKIDRTKVVRMRPADKFLVTPHRSLKPYQPAKEPFAPLPDPPQSQYNCTMVELDRTRCRWPLGDPRSGEFRYCGVDEADFPKMPYCKFHRLAQYNLK